jgi:hypothetical protein
VVDRGDLTVVVAELVVRSHQVLQMLAEHVRPVQEDLGADSPAVRVLGFVLNPLYARGAR